MQSAGQQSVPSSVHNKATFPLSATHFDTAVSRTVTVCAQGQEQQFRVHPDF